MYYLNTPIGYACARDRYHYAGSRARGHPGRDLGRGLPAVRHERTRAVDGDTGIVPTHSLQTQAGQTGGAKTCGPEARAGGETAGQAQDSVSRVAVPD